MRGVVGSMRWIGEFGVFVLVGAWRLTSERCFLSRRPSRQPASTTPDRHYHTTPSPPLHRTEQRARSPRFASQNLRSSAIWSVYIPLDRSPLGPWPAGVRGECMHY